MIYIHNTATGQIAQKVDAPDDHAEHYERSGHTAIVTEQSVDAARYYVQDGAFVRIPEKPSDYHLWDWQTHAWVESAALVATAYIAKRRAAYPPIGDQLDALWKGGEALEQMQGQILAVKAAYPKPQEGIE